MPSRRTLSLGLRYCLSLSLLTQSSLATAAPAWCGRYLRPSTQADHRELQKSLNEAGENSSEVLPRQTRLVKTYWNPSLRPDEIFDIQANQANANVSAHLDALVQNTEIEIENSAVQQVTETLYAVDDAQTTLATELHTVPERIPSVASSLVCNSGCSAVVRERLRLVSKALVVKMQAQSLPRKSIHEIWLDLHALGESLSQARDFQSLQSENPDAYLEQRHLYFSIISTTEGKLLLLPELQKRAASFTELDVRHAVLGLYRDVRDGWAARKAWFDEEAARLQADRSDFRWSEYLPHRLMIQRLSAYIQSAPLAVIAALKKNPAIQSDLCGFLEEIDDLRFHQDYQSSVSRFSWYIVPASIAVVGGIFLVGGGLGLAPIFLVGLTFKGLLAFEVARALTNANHIDREKQYVQTNLYAGVATAGTLSDFEKLGQEAKAERMEALYSVGLEVATMGLAHLAALRVEKVFAHANRDQKELWLRRLFDSVRGKRALFKKEIYNPAQLRKWVREADAKEIEEILFENRDFGFGRQILLTDAGLLAFQETYKMATKEVFTDINPFEYLMMAFDHSSND